VSPLDLPRRVYAALEAEYKSTSLELTHAVRFQNILNRVCPSVVVMQAAWGKVAVRLPVVVVAAVGSSHLHEVTPSGDTYAAMVVILAELHPAPSTELSALASVLLASGQVRWEVSP